MTTALFYLLLLAPTPFPDGTCEFITGVFHDSGFGELPLELALNVDIITDSTKTHPNGVREAFVRVRFLPQGGRPIKELKK